MDAFLYGIPWEKHLAAPDDIDKITKEDVVSISSKYFGDNKLVFHSKMGFPKKPKLDKPPYGAVENSSSEKGSDYAAMIEKMPVIQMDPKFIEFNEDVKIAEVTDGITTFVTNNPINTVFTIRLKYGKGSYRDPLVDQTSNIVIFL